MVSIVAYIPQLLSDPLFYGSLGDCILVGYHQLDHIIEPIQ